MTDRMPGAPGRVLRMGILAALPLLLGAAVPADPGATWAGRYAMEMRIGTVTRVPVVGSERSVTRTLLLVDMRRDGSRWVQRQTVCDVRIESPRMRMTVPAAFVRGLPPREYTGVVQGAGERAAFTADLGVEAIGYDPALTGGELPLNAAARGVVDNDGDGRPGATVIGHFPLFGRVRLFIAQRSHLVLHGRQTSDDRIEGTMEIRAMEQRTLGADNRLFRRTLPMQADPAASGFVMVRTAAADCAAVRRDSETLFR
ncbi:hypothetical protein [Longimicrobium terrae]|uniref:DUF3108 domain-containing protein n=1 Tax=Longimicrobium terrae TaxID=1639882 RepID=A0A841H7W1_9BACT|nr:hypothetical protein [Longimicrobium terrae]MBB4639555.1 hypothetical protein [Longimicrobium terrae]MBB6073926.1 hypothetical protein [Longimicrobium terrae]NNC30123.1 hypothetical protein [Longimicrobium terrae]